MQVIRNAFAQLDKQSDNTEFDKGISIMSDNPTSGANAGVNAGASAGTATDSRKEPTKHGLTILQWLAVAAAAGIVLTVILNYLR